METISKIRNVTEVAVRFNEVDSLGIVWHGHYLSYFEDGREAFGMEHEIGYMQVFSEGYVIPVTKIDCEYKRPLTYGDKISIETIYWDTPAAKLVFSYTIKKVGSDEIIATGKSQQVFLSRNNELCLNCPEFFLDWKRKKGLSS